MSATRATSQIVHRCTYHLAWCPKYRRRVLTSHKPALGNPPITGDPGPLDERLEALLREECSNHDCELVNIDIGPDYVHLVVNTPPQLSIADVVRKLKSRTSKQLREEFPSLRRRIPTLWTRSYFVATVGSAPLSSVKRYVESQRNV